MYTFMNFIKKNHCYSAAKRLLKLRIKIMHLKKDTGEKCVRTEAIEMRKIIGIVEEVEYDT